MELKTEVVAPHWILAPHLVQCFGLVSNQIAWDSITSLITKVDQLITRSTVTFPFPRYPISSYVGKRTEASSASDEDGYNGDDDGRQAFRNSR